MINLTIQNTIQNTIRSTLGDDAFSILDLFTGGRQGVWYSPSDLATLYQTSTGITPVTADGQPVGLMLDKSQGLELGDELITNGTFDTATNWILSAGWVISGGVATGVSTSININQRIPVVGGRTYVVEFDVVLTSHSVRAEFQGVFGKVMYTSGRYSSYFTLANTSSSQPLFIYGPSFEGSIDNVSVKEVLGIHASQPVATQRPTYNDNPDRLTLDLVDDSLAFTVPTGGWDGYMVVGTDSGTASYGVSLPAGDYDLGGDFFFGNSINPVVVREGAVSSSDLKKVEAQFVKDGAKASYGDVTDFNNYWRQKNITEFPMIDTSSGTNFYAAWRDNNLTSFPLLDTSNGTNFIYAWRDNDLTSFPLLDTSKGTNFSYAWMNNSLTSFPLLDTSSGTNFHSAWRDNSLTSFPLLDASNGITFQGAWNGNNLTSFPLLDVSNSTNFQGAWANNNNLTTFPANMFDNCLATSFEFAFTNTNLSQSSIDGILTSINSNGTSNGTFSQSGGSAPSSTGEAAIDALYTRGWTVTVTGGYQGQIVPATSGMTLSESWDTRGQGYGALKATTSASVRVDATISDTDNGILMESGATTYGLILYVFNGVLYFQCGDGSAIGTAASRAETTYTLPVGESDYIVEWSADTTNAVLYVNGVVVDSQVFNHTMLGGSDAGTVGRVASAVAVNRGGWTVNGQGDFTNTITRCDIYNGQVTSDV